MIRVVYPPALQQKALALEAPGGPPVTVSLAAPSVVAPDEPFDLRVAVLDQDGYPSVELDGPVALADPEGEPVQAVTFSRGQPAVAAVEGAVRRCQGFCRFQAELDGKTFLSNPVRVTADPRQRLYWGDPHVHTVLSRCHPDNCRSLNFCYAAARHLTGLDWVAAADHVSNGRCGPGKWRDQYLTSDLYDAPPRFVTLPAYEASLRGGCGGDNNVYMLRWPARFVDEYEDGNVRTLAQHLT